MEKKMFKHHAFRLGNTFLLGLIGLLAGCTLFVSHSAEAGDAFGTDCQPDWSVLSAGCNNGTQVTRWCGSYSCATSPTGLCCSYQVFGVFCDANGTETHLGTSYHLVRAGESGKTCTPMGCW